MLLSQNRKRESPIATTPDALYSVPLFFSENKVDVTCVAEVACGRESGALPSFPVPAHAISIPPVVESMIPRPTTTRKAGLRLPDLRVAIARLILLVIFILICRCTFKRLARSRPLLHGSVHSTGMFSVFGSLLLFANGESHLLKVTSGPL